MFSELLTPSNMGSIAALAVIALFVIVGLVMVREIAGMIFRGRQQVQVLKRGVSAPAVVLKVWQTGRSIGDVNADPELGLILEVRPTNRPAFQAETSTFVKVWDVPQLQPGAFLQVKYDPKDLRKVAVERIGGAANEAAAVAQVLQGIDLSQLQTLKANLSQMKSPQCDLQTRGISAPAQIQSAGNMGIMVDGVNPLIHLQLLVQATDRAPFPATVQTAVSMNDLAKYQPGATINVKYDPTNPNNVILDRS